MEDFVIKKVFVKVKIFPIFGKSIKGFLFLPESSKYHQGRESLYEYMNSDQEFVVFKHNKIIIFFNKYYIKMIKSENRKEEESLYTNIDYKEEECIVKFTDGNMIECKIRFEHNLYHNRIYDFLNHSPKFIIGIYEENFFLLNKNCISEIQLKG